jgi:hypothetical protein
MRGACNPPATFPATTFCCKYNFNTTGCSETVLSDVGALVNWLLNSCEGPSFGTHQAVVGTCGPSGCVPAY